MSSNNKRHNWQITPYIRWSETQFLQHFLPGTPIEQNGQQSFGVQLQKNLDFDSHHWIIGIDSEAVDAWLTQRQDSPTQGSEFLQETIPIGFHYDYQVTAYQFSPFIHADFYLHPNVTLSAGLRAEWLQYDYNNKLPAGRTRDDGTECGFGGCRYSRPASGVDTFFNASPKLGLSLGLSPSSSAYLSLASAFRVPQATELYRLQRQQQITDLRSEQLTSVELGFKTRTNSQQFHLAAYAQKKSHLIFRNSDFFNLDNGSSSHYGVEVEVTHRFSKNVTLDVNSSWALHRYEFTDTGSGIIEGNYIDTAPKVLANSQLNWRINTNNRVNIEWLFVDDYFTDPENQHSYTGHSLINIRSQSSVSKNVAFNIEILNFLDRKYAERADFTSFTGDRYTPGRPRSLTLGVKLLWY